MRPIKTPTFIIPTLFRYLVIAVLVLGGLWYAVWQGRLLIAGPEVSVTEAPRTVQSDRIVFIEGTALNATALFLNGRPIMIDQNGSFSEGVVLENGYSVISLDARDRYGRRVHWEKPVVYVAAQEKKMVSESDEVALGKAHFLAPKQKEDAPSEI